MIILVLTISFPLFMIILSTVFLEQVILALKDFDEWHKHHKFLGMLYYSLTLFCLIPITFPPVQLFIFGGFMFGQVYGKLAGFFVAYGVCLVVYPLTCKLTFLIGKRFFKNYIR